MDRMTKALVVVTGLAVFGYLLWFYIDCAAAKSCSRAWCIPHGGPCEFPKAKQAPP
ncbi:hypothetical protein BH11PSE4_BH11PSE4_29660 [soil metagenome]